jgi:hypothetical protein
MVTVTLEGEPDGGGPRVVLTVQGDPGQPDPVYTFDPVAATGTPAP